MHTITEIVCIGEIVNTNDGYHSHFIHSETQIVFTITFEYIVYERSHMAVLHTLDYDVNTEK